MSLRDAAIVLALTRAVNRPKVARAHISTALVRACLASPHVRSGVIKALGVTSAQRLKILPEVPTMAEAGFPGGMEFSLWSGLYAPKGTPPAVIDKLNKAVVDALGSEKVRDSYAKLGLDIAPRQKQTPQALAELQRTEIAKWWPIIESAGIKPQSEHRARPGPSPAPAPEFAAAATGCASKADWC